VHYKLPAVFVRILSPNCPRLKGNIIGLKSTQILENTKAAVRDFSTARQPGLLPG
jgi:hypothetical protein